MAQGQFLRNLIIETPSKPGNLGKVTMAIGQLNGDIGDIQTIKVGTLSTIREIALQCNDQKHLAEIVVAIENLKEGIKVQAVTDDVLQMHEGGKIHMKATHEIRSLADLRRVYTPGVASVCKTIQEDPEQANYFTGISNTVAIVTDGTAILGLGNIGPVAGMPVMEGKAVLFDQFVGISGIPILLDTSDPDEVVETIKHIHQGFGAILLEDIGSPHCFEIEERLKKELPIPVMHDDQHGTAVVALAATLTACKHVGVELTNASVGQIGLGAAGLAISRMFMAYGVAEMKGTDPNPHAKEMLAKYGGTVVETMEEIMETCDVVIATTGVANLIKPEMIRKGQIILALSNPNAEITPEIALEAGAAYAADGRLVNNVLGFPGIFRGALNANAKSITYPMLIAAALAIVDSTKRDDLVPHPLDPNVHINVALAVEKVVYEEQDQEI
ncbi:MULTISPECIES: NAD-dependent malic enzyme [unclassified Sporosarcina]|uniref:NAD-dependent malic enzyme n=1 Tax=unclassified Sporosarcina TaxID=2647733 RepID=UPI000C16C107|nr:MULTISPECIES: NAD(P)-dependent oxidoreductase [unclassified Sporosarcina]PID03870.1 NAD-dependent malic enzyme 1 [Sporosarcina sp. P30]PID07471.1 NAD-dependent malic enzyme 1 [Sporosarcina sp. P31]PID10679.1 NAD-dependent malic enzyme 1 [Sporosarcina sp. P32b]